MTCTVLMTILPVLPALSTYQYSNTYVPSTPVLTTPLSTKLPVFHRIPVKTLPVPSTLSVQYAPSSVYHVPCATMSDQLPFNTTTGATSSTIDTVLVTRVPVFPALSTYRYSKIYVPTSHVFTNPLVGMVIIPLPSRLSVRLAPLSP